MTDSNTDACRGFGVRPLHSLKSTHKSNNKSNPKKLSPAVVEKRIVVKLDRLRNTSETKTNLSPMKFLAIGEKSFVSSINTIPSTSPSSTYTGSSISGSPPIFNFVHPLSGNLIEQRRNVETVDDLESYLFECSTCNLTCEIASIFLHAKEVHGVFICLYCLQFYKFAKKLMVHLHREHRVASQRYANGVELLQQGGNNTLLSCVECNKTFLSEDVETMKTHARECRKGTGICPKCGTILLLSLLGVHIAGCKDSMNLNLEENSSISTSQPRSRDDSCKCSKTFSPSEITAHNMMTSCSDQNLGFLNRPVETDSASETIALQPKHQITPSQKRAIPPLPPLRQGKPGNVIPSVDSKKSKVMPQLYTVPCVAPVNSLPLMSSTSISSSSGTSSIGKLNNPGLTSTPSSSDLHLSSDVAKPKVQVLPMKPQKCQPKAIIKKPKRGRPRSDSALNSSKPPESADSTPIKLPSPLKNLPTLTPMSSKIMNEDLESIENVDTISVIEANLPNSNKKDDLTMDHKKRAYRPGIQLEDDTNTFKDVSGRPKRCLKKVTREDFIYDTISKRSHQRSHSVSGSSMSATVTPSVQLKKNTKRPIKVLTGGTQRHSMSVSEIVMDSGSIDFDKFPSKSLQDIFQDKGQMNPNKRKSVVLSSSSRVYSPSVSIVPLELYEDESSESEPEPEVKLDPLLVEQDDFRRLGILITELCEKLNIFPAAPDEGQTHELLVNYRVNDKSDDSILTDMVNKSSDSCVYCRQVKIIRVDKRQLVMHLLSMHSWDLKCLPILAMLIDSMESAGEKMTSQKTSAATDEKIKDEESDVTEMGSILKLNDNLKTFSEEKIPPHFDDKIPPQLDDKIPQQLDDKIPPQLDYKIPQQLKDEVSLQLEDKVSQPLKNQVSLPVEDTHNKIEKFASEGKTDDILLPPNESAKSSDDQSMICPSSVETTATTSSAMDTTILPEKNSDSDIMDSTSILNSEIPEADNCESQKVENPINTDVLKTLDEVLDLLIKIEEEKDENKDEEDNSCLIDNKEKLEEKLEVVGKQEMGDDIKIQLKESNNTDEAMDTGVSLAKPSSCEDETAVIQIEWNEFKLALLEKVFRSDNIVFAYKDSNLQPFGEIPCECLLCGFMADSQRNLFPHWRRVHRGVEMKCAMCHGKFLFAGALFSHLCFGTPSPVVTVSNNSSDAVLNPMSPSAGPSNVNIPASEINIVADNGEDQVKRNDGSSDTTVLRYQCSICENFQLPSFFNYMVHLRKDHNTCELCLETTKTQKDLEHHMKNHKLNHFCWECGLTYCEKPNFMTHLFWKHGTESEDCSKCLKKKWPHAYHFCIPPPTFTCDVCGYFFTKPKSLIVHKRLHTGEKLKSCLREGCLEKFVSKKLLAKHIENVHINPPRTIEPIPEPIKENAADSNPATTTVTNEMENSSVDPQPEDTSTVAKIGANGLTDSNNELSLVLADDQNIEKSESKQVENASSTTTHTDEDNADSSLKTRETIHEDIEPNDEELDSFHTSEVLENSTNESQGQGQKKTSKKS